MHRRCSRRRGAQPDKSVPPMKDTILHGDRLEEWQDAHRQRQLPPKLFIEVLRNGVPAFPVELATPERHAVAAAEVDPFPVQPFNPRMTPPVGSHQRFLPALRSNSRVSRNQSSIQPGSALAA